MSKCGDCKFWDRENQKLARIRYGIDGDLEEYGVARCNHRRESKDGKVLLAWCVDYPCSNFKPLKPKPTRAEMHKKLDDLLDGRD